MRTAPTGPPKGMSEIIRAAEAALIAKISNGFVESADSDIKTTCTSLRIPSGKSGLSGRSASRATSVASVLGLPSLRKNEPGIFPPAYIRSSYSTVRGKKSVPSRTAPIVAAAKITESPWRKVSAPPAWRASRPVSKVTSLSPK